MFSHVLENAGVFKQDAAGQAAFVRFMQSVGFKLSLIHILAFIISMAYSRFCSWLRWVWQLVTMPVGLWIRRTAEEVLLMCWPPAPEER